MTRETKIGLLVGLTFIIIVGILLSPSINSSYESQSAQLPVVGQNVRAGVTTPGAGQPPVSMVDAGNVAPVQRVPTQREVASRTPNGGGGVISIGPGDGENGGSGRIEVGISGRPPSLSSPGVAETYRPPPISYHTGTGDGSVTLEKGNHASGSIDGGIPLSNGGIPGDLAREAARQGEPLVPADGSGGRSALAGSKQYTAGAGDSLSRITAKFYGSNTKAGREAIIKANPSLTADPNKIISGRTYIIPGTSVAPAVSSTGTLRELQPPIRAVPVAPAAPTTLLYTVKENDSLWKIAKEQLNDPGLIASIKELNKDVLAGGDQVRPNMKLRLPAKAN